ncbi:MAG: AarF/UbiB family protein [Rickettsiales bacterium]
MTERDDNTLGGRVRRYARVTGAVGGLAARAAGQRYLGLDLGKQAMPADLKAALGGLKGPLMKVAQILATIPDALPQEYLDELRQLQANAPSMGRLFVRRRMTTELGPDWKSKFLEFEEEAVAAASLGQVLWAVHPDGRALAFKLQYPDMASIVEADLKQLRFAISIYERYDKAIRASEIYKELVARMREELDYRREAAQMALYRHMLESEPGAHVPEAIAELSTDRAGRHAIAEFHCRTRRYRDPQPGGAQHVPGLVRAVLFLRHHPRRPASRQLHGARGRLGQSDGFRLYPGVRAQLREGCH